MPELLLEVGCEELPAAFIRKAYTDLLERVAGSLGELYGAQFQGIALGTPRRLIISIPEVPARQPDATKEMRGPALRAAFNEAGEPTPALLGFCRSNGVDPSQLRKDDQYVWLTKAIPGLPTGELLAEALPKAIKSLTFEKSMRWGSARLRFARPLRWILAAFDGKAIEFEIEGVRAGLESRGHRFYAPDLFPATSLSELVIGLRDRKVEPDVDRRITEIIDQTKRVANGTPDLPDDLVDENAFLTEWPTAILGEFRPSHLSLPDPVLTTAMAKHERMFPIRNTEANLVNQFVFIRNSGEDKSVQRGAEWVLNARLDDAQFFFKEDAKHDLDYFLEKTSGIVFQEKLGTVRERSDRLASLAGELAARSSSANGQEIEYAKLAGKYAKADLSTGLVSDMASLQGVVGGEYAKRQTMPEAVCLAISNQYDHSKSVARDDEAGRTGLRLCIADNLDKLVGYLGIGLVPSGSSDPFGLRRAATVLIDIGLRQPAFIPFNELQSLAVAEYSRQGKQLQVEAIAASMDEVFRSRYSALFTEVPHDILEAATASNADVTFPGNVRFRIEVLSVLAQDSGFVQTALRPINILSSAAKKGVGFNPDGLPSNTQLTESGGSELREAAEAAEREIARAQEELNPKAAVGALLPLLSPINGFMDANMIMSDVEAERHRRLSLLRSVTKALDKAGDFTKLVIEG